MKRIIILIVVIMLSTNVFSQSVESIIKRVSSEICDCVKDGEDSELKKRLKECTDEKINLILINSTKAENKLLFEEDNLEYVIINIEPYVLKNCDNLKHIEQSKNEEYN